MTEAKLLEQESTVTKHLGGLLRACERRDWIGLGIPRISMGEVCDGECTNGVSNNKNRVLELLRAVRGKPLDRTHRPSRRVVPKNVIGGI